jgi:thiol:disulfide interchange protein
MRQFFALALSAIALAAGHAAHAGPVRPYSQAALQSAQKAGQSILVDVHADWCPTCRAQDPSVAAIARDPAFARLTIFKLDFDSQKAERLALGVQKQSTLIVYRGASERGRSTGVIAPGQIKALAAQALR